MSVISSGYVLAGRYRLEREIGGGGMGTVWRGHDAVLNRDVAVKEVRLRTNDEDLQAELCLRTEREARATARIRHLSVVSVYDVVTADERPWIVMELLTEVRSLEQIVREDGPLDPGYAAEIGRQIAGALRAAHAQGVLHRDVKPSNVLITPEGRAVLTDFGIAAIEGASSITKTDVVVGSAGYVAPERTYGAKATPASDLWALGVTLYTAVEGLGLHRRRQAMAILSALMSDQPVPLERAGPLSPIIEGLLRTDPGDRLDGAAAQRMLTRVATGDSAEVVVSPAQEADRIRLKDNRIRPRDNRGTHRRPAPYEHLRPPVRSTGRHGKKAGIPSTVTLLAIGIIAMAVVIGVILIVL